MEGFEKLEGDRLGTVRERHIEVELEVFIIGALILLQELWRGTLHRRIFKTQTELVSDHLSDQVNKAEDACSCRNGGAWLLSLLAGFAPVARVSRLYRFRHPWSLCTLLFIGF